VSTFAEVMQRKVNCDLDYSPDTAY